MLPAGKQTQFGEMRRDRFSVTLAGQSCGCFNPIIWKTGSAYPGRKAPSKEFSTIKKKDCVGLDHGEQ